MVVADALVIVETGGVDLELLAGVAVARLRRKPLLWAQRVRDFAIYVVPTRWRARVADIVPSQRLLPYNLRRGHIDDVYRSAHDPYGFDTNSYEMAKYERTVELCGSGRLGRVLEIGCSIGTFTELVAPRSEAVLATDVSPVAVDRTRVRLERFPNVSCEVCDVSQTSPTGPFDVVVASDVLYFLSPRQLESLLRRLEDALTPGGRLVAVHYIPRMGTLLNADEAHDLLIANTTLDHVHTERPEFAAGRTYRIDVLARPVRVLQPRVAD